ALEEKQARVFSRRFRLLLGVRIDLMEPFDRPRVIDHLIERRYDDSGIHMGVVREERADIPERHGCVIASVVPGQQKTTETSESGCVRRSSTLSSRRKCVARFLLTMCVDQSSRLSARTFDNRSAIWTLFRSDVAKCVLPRMLIVGSSTSV